MELEEEGRVKVKAPVEVEVVVVRRESGAERVAMAVKRRCLRPMVSKGCGEVRLLFCLLDRHGCRVTYRRRVSRLSVLDFGARDIGGGGNRPETAAWVPLAGWTTYWGSRLSGSVCWGW